MSLQHIQDAFKVQLPPLEKYLLIYLSHYANAEQVAWPSTDRILRETCLGKTTFYKIIGKLKRLGMIIQTKIKTGYGVKKAYRVVVPEEEKFAARTPESSPHEPEKFATRTHSSSSDQYRNSNKDREAKASGNVIQLFKDKDSGEKKMAKEKMPVGAPLSQTIKHKLAPARKKKAGPDSTSELYRQFRQITRDEFNFKLPDPTPKDLGMMKHLVTRWGENTLPNIETILQNYSDFRLFYEQAEGEILKGVYVKLSFLLSHHHLAESFRDWLAENKSSGHSLGYDPEFPFGKPQEYEVEEIENPFGQPTELEDCYYDVKYKG